MSLPERLDDLANMTGFPQFSRRFAAKTQHGLHLRWSPIVALTLATAGIVVAAAAPHPHYALGISLLSLAQAIATTLSLLGPIKPFGTLVGVDERDRQLRRDGYLAAFAAVSFVAIVALLALTGLALIEPWDRDRLLFMMPVLAFYLLCLLLTIPTLYASWATRPIEDE
ncbi:hypothetical protein GCM10009087_10090 [Sphingomonas oligophenolica]|uniref:Uncharacterized protein n=1 Tax=Sphingomonas oligophenolica TaxID=301154 RepID=A0ABU9Y8J3_9SPHN